MGINDKNPASLFATLQRDDGDTAVEKIVVVQGTLEDKNPASTEALVDTGGEILTTVRKVAILFGGGGGDTPDKKRYNLWWAGVIGSITLLGIGMYIVLGSGSDYSGKILGQSTTDVVYVSSDSGYAELQQGVESGKDYTFEVGSHFVNVISGEVDNFFTGTAGYVLSRDTTPDGIFRRLVDNVPYVIDPFADTVYLSYSVSTLIGTWSNKDMKAGFSGSFELLNPRTYENTPDGERIDIIGENDTHKVFSGFVVEREIKKYDLQLVGLIPSSFAESIISTPYRWDVAKGANVKSFDYSNFMYYTPQDRFSPDTSFRIAQSDDGDVSMKYNQIIPQSIFDAVPAGGVDILFVSYNKTGFQYSNNEPDITSNNTFLLFVAIISNDNIFSISNAPKNNKTSTYLRELRHHLEGLLFFGKIAVRQLESSDFVAILEGINYKVNETFNSRSPKEGSDPISFFEFYEGKNIKDFYDGTDIPGVNIPSLYDNGGVLDILLNNYWGIYRISFNKSNDTYILTLGKYSGDIEFSIARVYAVDDNYYEPLSSQYTVIIGYFIARAGGIDFADAKDFQIVKIF